MNRLPVNAGISTIVTHYLEGDHPLHAHIMPIFQTSTFGFPDAETARAVFRGEREGYLYTRAANPNSDQLAQKYAYLEGLDIIRAHPDTPPEQLVHGRLFASGMAAISAAILAKVQAGDTVITQRHLYGNAYRFFYELAPRLGIHVVWLDDVDVASWEKAFADNPHAVLAYTETPTNPTMRIVDLAAVAQIAHEYEAMVVVDNTFATPYHQRPLSLGCDAVVHSTTKYLSGHGVLIGGVVISPDETYMKGGKGEGVAFISRILGATPSPFDAWLGHLGLKTFELRMQRHSENAMTIARWLDAHPKVARVHYPGLATHPGYEIARRQMFNGFGGMISFELVGGYEAGVTLMEHVRLATLAVSLGNVDTLIEHPASMTHVGVPPEEREKVGITDGLVRLSVGIENVEDIIADLEYALGKV
ncbi:MAG: PLP-dependent transferase [Chloroflexi bacterium]|nr:PLP-dependent transferase [Chloroflexota bacterium]